MKKSLLLAFLFAFLSSTTLKADLGSCVVYHAKFYLKNGAIFKGCFEVAGYFDEASLDDNGTNKFCTDQGVFQVFKIHQRSNGKIPVYKNLQYVHPRSMHRKKASDESPAYGFVYPADKLLLDSSEISRMVFWSAEYSKRFWLTSEVLVGTPGMLDTMRHQKYWNSLVFSADNESDTVSFEEYNFINGPYSGYALYNYNPQINVAELKRLIALKFPIDYDLISKEFKRKYKIKDDQAWTTKQLQQYEAMMSRKLQSIKQWFWRKGILVVVVNGTC